MDSNNFCTVPCRPVCTTERVYNATKSKCFYTLFALQVEILLIGILWSTLEVSGPESPSGGLALGSSVSWQGSGASQQGSWETNGWQQEHSVAAAGLNGAALRVQCVKAAGLLGD